MDEISLHLLDIIENCIRAGARVIRLEVAMDRAADTLSIVVEDDGRGMPADLAERVFDPFVTTRTERRFGLGLPMLKQAAEQAGGSARLESVPGKGTRVEARFCLSHPDRQPLGDLGQTVAAVLAHEADFRLEVLLVGDGPAYLLESAALEEELGTGCFRDGAVLTFVAETVLEKQSSLGLKQ
ncbi:MAG: ATP-binding protein [Deltaproteobacteria bacterium]|nr:ATP-binding protein [Deltaproteobacteria bacterium]